MSTCHRLGLGAEACHDRFQYAHRQVGRVVFFDGGDLLPEPGEGVAEGDEPPGVLLDKEQLGIGYQSVPAVGPVLIGHHPGEGVTQRLPQLALAPAGLAVGAHPAAGYVFQV